MSNYMCECCKEEFDYDEMVFLNGENEVEDEEHGGSGDIDEFLCGICYEVQGEIEIICRNYGISLDDISNIAKYIKIKKYGR